MFKKEEDKISYIENDKEIAYISFSIFKKNIVLITDVFIPLDLNKDIEDELFKLLYDYLNERKLKIKCDNINTADLFKHNKLLKKVIYKEIYPLSIVLTFVLGFVALIFSWLLFTTIYTTFFNTPDILGAFILLVFGILLYILPFIIISIYYIILIICKRFSKYDYINIGLYFLIIIEIIINLLITFI